MKRIILDTNIYGRIVDRKEQEEISGMIEKKRDVVVYGFDIVRKELRKVSSEAKVEKGSLRIVLLGLYDRMVKSHLYYTTPQITELANDYYTVYRQVGGMKTKKEMENDFLIVACASLHGLDIVVSEDNRTMLSDPALKTYKIVNALKRYGVPGFVGYENFRRLFS